MPSTRSTSLRIICVSMIGLMLFPGSPHAKEPPAQVVQLGVYGQDSAAWADWQAFARQNPQIVSDLKPQVIADAWRHTLIGLPQETDAHQSCQRLRQRGWQCFVTTLDKPTAAPVLEAADASDTPSPGLQLALYYNQDAAERGWQQLRARFPNLLAQVTPIYERVNRYVALRAIAASIAERDRLCLELRQRGAECLPTLVPSSARSLPADADTSADSLDPERTTSVQSGRFRHGGVTTTHAPSPLGPDSILISTTDRKLLYQASDGTLYVWPIAVGRHPSYHIFGDTEITVKRPHPTWTPPPEMRRRNPRLPRSVGPGPKNPLGAYALNLGFPYIRIHGTDKPQSVGRAASSGCYRMHADAIEFLFKSVSVGTPVRITDRPLETSIQLTSSPP